MSAKWDGPVLSLQAAQRLPAYLEFLKGLEGSGRDSVSSALAAEHFKLSEAQVRKDFAALSRAGGKPRAGFRLRDLIDGIEEYLGIRSCNEAALVGAGALGHALLSFEGFREYGLNIALAFDRDPERCGRQIHGIDVLPSGRVSEMCRRLGILIGIIVVPADQAQVVCDQLVAGGVLAVWNFAPTHLSVPDGILVQNENMAVSLAALARHLRDSMRVGDK